MKLECSDFGQGQKIPAQHTCSGRNISPQISWGDVPEGTRSFVLILDDPDASAGVWTHWIAYNIPGGQRELPARIDAVPRLPDGTMQGVNDFRKIGYGGPCPPAGHGPHRYFFKLYALDDRLDLEPGANKRDLERAMEGHVLGQAEFMARYQR